MVPALLASSWLVFGGATSQNLWLRECRPTWPLPTQVPAPTGNLYRYYKCICAFLDDNASSDLAPPTSSSVICSSRPRTPQARRWLSQLPQCHLPLRLPSCSLGLATGISSIAAPTPSASDARQR